MNELKVISRSELDQMITKRTGETKLGETMQTLDMQTWETNLRSVTAKFVLLGIPEDIGVRANYGVGGAQTMWLPALKAIVNVQETVSLQGSNIALLGYFDFEDWQKETQMAAPEQLRELVSAIDDKVFPVIKAIAEAGKIPIIIGGGHNNAYPILKGMSRAKSQAVNCINLDAHSDYRAIEGRHSGNGFRYAKMDGYLKRYAMVGLHRNYNGQHIIDEITSDPDLHLCFFEDIFLEEKNDFRYAIEQAVRFTAGLCTGIEIDMDCIEYALASAATPSGITATDARRFISRVTHGADVAYLHITEGSSTLADGRTDPTMAKLVAYLATDFIRAYTNRPTVFIRETAL